MTHICVSKLTIIGSDNSLLPGRHQAIIWTNAGILLIRHLGTNFNEILIEILTFSFMKMRLKVLSAKWRLFFLGLNVVSYRISEGLFSKKIMALPVTSHYLNQWWRGLLMHICVTQPQWVNEILSHTASKVVNRMTLLFQCLYFDYVAKMLLSQQLSVYIYVHDCQWWA